MSRRKTLRSNGLRAILAAFRSKTWLGAMNEHVVRRGMIDQVPETRPEWLLWPYHYDFRLTLAGREVYIETILQDDDPNDPTVHIVSIHDV
jgi:hypothetical protein